MNNGKLLTYVITFFISMGIIQNNFAIRVNAYAFTEENRLDYDIIMKQDLLCIMIAYPDLIVKVEKTIDDKVYLVTKGGSKLLYDDKKQKSPKDKLSYPDLQDMLETKYPLQRINRLMDEDHDPGRRRIYPLLKEVYGGSKEKVQSNLVRVKVGYTYLDFNKNNKAAESLKNAMSEISGIIKDRGNIGACIFPPSGTFNYRLISGTNQLSAHAFGIAIDLKSDKRDYWKWASRQDGEKRMLSYPTEIVEVFEKNNFVWGGKWGHFDILHFEYRPEIIYKARYFGGEIQREKPWYFGAPIKDSNVNKFIKVIDEGIGS
ncbi:hypothetical protein CLHOM_09490 [Clostridium homopropionicum DSM 5847]|uniref:Peptidase M15C domain-containing protein n=1 Tax=Clostridium homopropionicum DSM 5847 TaxID=1121318 RepID=A0A0L6ZCW1_9CLOT|nr:M15 family metallopeptidase [Clostridium homopropionicum]KOA20806.1 hypothetical protein CLHOM_09490 [Clostridium homopropionicum DSM 5847]SFF88684.1 D-alanyl-D-alanine carboxypeptidase [Clostridium homopropionicum]